MYPDPRLPDSSQDALLKQAISAIRDRDTSRAETLLIQLVKQQPDSFEAWYLLASISTDARQARLYARQALRIQPQNRQAIALLRRIETGSKMPPRPRPRRRPWTFRGWLGISLLVGTLGLILSGFVVQSRANQANVEARPQSPPLEPSPSPTPLPTWTPTPSIADRTNPYLAQLGDAWSARDWHRAVDILTAITAIDPHYPGLDSAKCDTYLHWARDLVQSGVIDQAYLQYRRGTLYCGQKSDLIEEKDLALTYLSGQWRWEHQDWQRASVRLQQVYETQSDYAQVSSLLYTSYISSCHELLAEGHLELAQQSVQQALVVQPDSKQAQALLEEIRARLAPRPTPVPAYTGDKRIEISLSEQRMYVWAGDQLVYKWVCSTGEPGRETIPGNFQILDKYPEAWASTWGIRMPYWMGIYWAGTLENGIHALPINPDGSRLWEGLLGLRVSYGCVILSTENARTLYNWAPVGTPVRIHY